MAHAGSWFGLPDFGITESIGNIFGTPRTSQGGSNLVTWSPFASSGSTLGENTSTITPPQDTGNSVSGGFGNTGGTSYGYSPITSPVVTQPQQRAQQQVQNQYGNLINQINSYSDQLMSGLNPQRQAQEDIVNNNFNQGVSDLNSQLAQGNAQLDTSRRKATENQVKTLNDLTENLRNMFSTGQNYLGARGAADSSAANQYSYAISKMGNQNRGNVLAQTTSIMNDINDRANQLQMQVTQGVKQLNTEKANALSGIAQWYANAQNQIRQTKGQNLQALGESALNQAISALNDVNNQFNSRYNSLMTWAENNSKTIGDLKNNLSQISQYSPANLTLNAMNGLPQGGAVGSNGAYYPGSNNTKYDIYGNVIQ